MERFILITLVTLPAVWSGGWGVIFENQCALKGTSVVIKCKYDYPDGQMVTSVNWYRARLVYGEYRLFPLSGLSPPTEYIYLGNKTGDCSLQINNVKQSDEGAYYFFFWTTYDIWRSQTPARLFVRELGALVQPSTVAEGDRVSLTCVQDCPTPKTVLWFRDGQPVQKAVFKASREDAGRYHCALQGQEAIKSVPVALNVQYRPMNVVVSVDPPRVTEGGSVNLTCSCAANPAADNYTWYKRSDSPGSSSLIQVGSGPVMSLLSADPSHAGIYVCRAVNSLGRNHSSEVLLTLEGKDPGIQPLPVLAGVGVSLILTLVVALYLIWRKWKSCAQKKNVMDLMISGGDSSSSEHQEQPETLYATIQMLPSSPPAVTAAHDLTSALKRNSGHSHDTDAFDEDEVTYSTVTVKARNHSPLHHGRALQNSRPKTEEHDSVIYASVAKS